MQKIAKFIKILHYDSLYPLHYALFSGMVRESIRIGWTTLGEDQVREILSVLDGRYGGNTYDVVTK